MKTVRSITINLDAVKNGLLLHLDARKNAKLYDAEDDAINNLEARFQLVEGCFYDYSFSDSSYIFGEIEEQIIQSHTRNKHTGTIAPNIFVGTISLPILHQESGKSVGAIELEVQSVKTGYRDDYRDMLEFITDKCTDLLLQSNAPVYQHFETDFIKNANQKLLYQRFAFIRSVIGTDEFSEAVHRVVTYPVTKWTEVAELKDIRQAKRFSNTNIKEILLGGNRFELPESHYLREFGFNAIPERITTIRKTDSVDTPENRFVKHALEIFLKFCTDIKGVSDKGTKLEKDSTILILELESQLSHSVFKSISRPETLKLNSPVLQRKEGYREVLRVWLMFDLAAKLIWTGGDDIYSGGKKDIATLYEYWLFFKLLELFQSLFEIEPKDIEELVKETPDGLNLQLKQGISTVLRGIYNSNSRKINVRFNYNRSFSGRSNYPDSGSWTTTLRPDYTLSFWPVGISEEEAENQELIVHIHFDAKYKISNFNRLIEQNSVIELDELKIENRKDIYKNADLLKMHAYRDAIRRTGGAYVLYPGDIAVKQRGFHEIIPGLGAFPVRPDKTDSGIGELKAFILQIIDHFINRATQRERLAYRTYDIFQNPPEYGKEVNEYFPETIGDNRSLLPDETHVLIGYYKSRHQLEWILKGKKYNFRTGLDKGSLPLGVKEVSAQFLVLHGKDESITNKIYKLTGVGPKIYSKQNLIDSKYPSIPTGDLYLMYEIEKDVSEDFNNQKFDIKKLDNYSGFWNSAKPITVSLSKLMAVVIK